MKIGIALGGGGARGSYQIGVLKALMETSLYRDIKVISGTSIGAINALLVMGGMDDTGMERIWSLMSNKNIYIDGFKGVNPNSKRAFDLRYMYETLEAVQPRIKVQKSKIIGYAITTKIKDKNISSQLNIHDMELTPLCLNKAKDPYEVALASASIPLLFGPTEINEEFYIDGGLTDNNPVPVLLKEGCDILLVISLFSGFNAHKFAEEAMVIDFTPRLPLGAFPLAVLDFSKRNIKRRINQGYKAGRFVLEQLKNRGIINEAGTIIKYQTGLFGYRNKDKW